MGCDCSDPNCNANWRVEPRTRRVQVPFGPTMYGPTLAERKAKKRREKIATAVLAQLVNVCHADSRGITNETAPKLPEMLTVAAVMYADRLIAELDK